MAADVDGDAVAQVIVDLAEAEAAEAEALAEAARARATAARLGVEAPGAPMPGRFSRWWRRLAVVVAVLLICASSALSSLMIWQHRQTTAQRAHETEFVEAAKKGVIALLSLDYHHAKDDVQRVVDASTGSFKDDFVRDADDFVKTAQDSKAVTIGSVSAAALESVNGDSGVVLLAASSKVTNSNGAQQDPRAWRMSVTLSRDGGQLKMSNVEFVP